MGNVSVDGMDFSKTTSVLKAASRPLTMQLVTFPAEELKYVGTRQPRGKRAERDSYDFEFTSKSLGLALQPIPAIQQQLHKQEGGQMGFTVQVETLLANSAAAKCGLISRGDIITHINGANLDGLSYEGATKLLTSADRPILLSFLPLSKYITDAVSRSLNLASVVDVSSAAGLRRDGVQSTEVCDTHEHSVADIARRSL